MNVLDENVPDGERAKLRRYRIRFRQIGREVGRSAMSDAEVITLLHGLDQPTFFTRDSDYFKKRLVHSGYCLVHLDVRYNQIAEYARRVLKHSQLNTRAKRMGCVLSASPQGLTGWRLQPQESIRLSWNTTG
jgi:hypothetical protein